MRGFFIVMILAMSTLMLGSCRLLRPSEMFKTPKDQPVASFEPTKYEYTIQPFDAIQLRVTSNAGESFFANIVDNGGGTSYQRNQQGYVFNVEYDGTVKIPVLGRVKIDSLTVRQAEDLLEERFADYFVNPLVLLEVTNRKVMIFLDGGTRSSIVNMQHANLTLIEAIAQIGGLSDVSRAYRIKLIRGDLTQNPEIYYWNISSIADLKNSNIFLEANDVIYIDSKPQYISRVLKELSPYLSLITTLLSVYGIFFK